MIARRWWLAGFALGAGWFVARTSAADDEAARVVVVANAGDSDSMALASFYVAQRRIPDANIVALPLPTTETITWDVFDRELYRPLRHWLVAHQWVDGTIGPAPADGSPPEVAVSGHHLSYLVLCRGVPLRIAHDPARLTEEFKAANAAQWQTNAAAVDGELALLAARNDLRHINGAARNPLFDVAHPSLSLLETIVRVTRLDGPDYAACEQLVLSALAGEERGLGGRAYIDRGGPHPEGDAWLDAATALVRARDFDVVENGPGGMFGATDRFDAPAIYLGWYAADLNGPMAAAGFRFPAGAIALHIHSFSATSMRSDTKGWTAPLVARGVAATVGNVNEPYLGLTHRPDLMMTALFDGRTWGDAAYYALPALSWQAIAVGDPLYRPFAHSLADQVSALDDRADPAAQYVALRETNFLIRTGRREDAVGWLAKAARQHPGLALSLRLAQERERDGDQEAALRALTFFTVTPGVKVDEIGVVAEAAELAMKLGAVDQAVEIYRGLLEQPELTEAWRRVLLPRARDAAAKADAPTLQRRWTDELESLR